MLRDIASFLLSRDIGASTAIRTIGMHVVNDMYLSEVCSLSSFFIERQDTNELE